MLQDIKQIFYFKSGQIMFYTTQIGNENSILFSQCFAALEPPPGSIDL